MTPEEIKTLRERFGTGDEFARELEVSPSTVWRWEIGKTTPRKIYLRKMLKLATSKRSL